MVKIYLFPENSAFPLSIEITGKVEFMKAITPKDVQFLSSEFEYQDATIQIYYKEHVVECKQNAAIVEYEYPAAGLLIMTAEKSNLEIDVPDLSMIQASLRMHGIKMKCQLHCLKRLMNRNGGYDNFTLMNTTSETYEDILFKRCKNFGSMVHMKGDNTIEEMMDMYFEPVEPSETYDLFRQRVEDHFRAEDLETALKGGDDIMAFKLDPSRPCPYCNREDDECTLCGDLPFCPVTPTQPFQSILNQQAPPVFVDSSPDDIPFDDEDTRLGVKRCLSESDWNSKRPKKEEGWDGICHCIECNEYLGNGNPRQLCRKEYCGNTNQWYIYDENKELIQIMRK